MVGEPVKPPKDSLKKLYQNNANNEPEGGRIICPSCDQPTMIGNGETWGLIDETPEVVIDKSFRGTFSSGIAETFIHDCRCISEECGISKELALVRVPPRIGSGTMLIWEDGEVVEFLNDDGRYFTHINGLMHIGRINWV